MEPCDIIIGQGFGQSDQSHSHVWVRRLRQRTADMVPETDQPDSDIPCAQASPRSHRSCCSGGSSRSSSRSSKRRSSSSSSGSSSSSSNSDTDAEGASKSSSVSGSPVMNGLCEPGVAGVKPVSLAGHGLIRTNPCVDIVMSTVFG